MQARWGHTHLDHVRHEVGQLLVQLDLLLVVLDLVLLILDLVVELRDLLLVDVDLGLDHARLAQDGLRRHPACVGRPRVSGWARSRRHATSVRAAMDGGLPPPARPRAGSEGRLAQGPRERGSCSLAIRLGAREGIAIKPEAGMMEGSKAAERIKAAETHPANSLSSSPNTSASRPDIARTEHSEPPRALATRAGLSGAAASHEKTLPLADIFVPMMTG